MATSSRKNNESNDYSVEEKIIALYELQKIDSKIDEINKIKGELPLEVQDLEDEIAGLETRIANITSEIDGLTASTKQRKEEIEQAKTLIAKYEHQQDNVRNNREFDSLSKEIELCEKKIKEYSADSKVKKKMIEDAQAIVADRKIDLAAKKAELESIDQETAKEIESLAVQSETAAVKIDSRLLAAYKRIRENVHNGLAVVTVKRDACGGCYNRIPPQRQLDIRMNKKIIVCEYCGRILVSNLLDENNAEE